MIQLEINQIIKYNIYLLFLLSLSFPSHCYAKNWGITHTFGCVHILETIVLYELHTELRACIVGHPIQHSLHKSNCIVYSYRSAREQCHRDHARNL